MKKFSSIAIFVLAVMMVVLASGLMSCKKQIIDNENTRLVLAIGELDGVFNPFYSSSATDGEIVGMTQLSMFTTDINGKVAFGEDEACAVLDYESVPQGSGDDQTTTYRFVLKNNLKFSDGKPLTMRDVLFNIYVYLDPVYTGSSTMYSTEIVGLAEYRTQSRNPNEQDSFENDYETLAWERLERLAEELQNVYDNNSGKVLTDAEVKAGLQETIDLFKGLAEAETNPEQKKELLKYGTLIEDYESTKKTFLNELKRDYQLAKGTAEDINFLDGKAKLTTDTEAFLYNEGFITWNKKDEVFEYAFGEKSKDWTEEQAINAVYESYVPNDVPSVVFGSQTTNELLDAFTAAEKKAYFDSLGEQDKITNVSGITFANRTESVTVNNKNYAAPTYNADGSVATGNEVLQIVIKKVDPKAIWNFAFAIAPMHYYSNATEMEKFDYVDHFGVSFGDPDFMNNSIKNTDKIGVPVGAGPYKATTRTGGGTVNAGSFKENNVVYFERNENFLFPAKIKYVNYQVVDTKMMLDSLFAGDIHFVEPACRQENIDIINANKGKGFDRSYVMTNGYGYIGINAEKVPSLAVRQAIMHAINTKLCTDYYAGYSYNIYRPMTRASWAYPKETDELGQYYKYDDTGTTSENLVKAAGYVKNSDGIYQKGDDVLSYIFTVAGDSNDHPAYSALQNAMIILNAHGFDIRVQKDINALKKLNSGDLTVWAAAWGSGVDPDMYQVYHIDSLAGSTSNWGYRAIRRNANHKYDTELGIVENLSKSIDLARQTLDEDARKAEYATALNLVMSLAVELPTYQRSDLYAYNTKIIDVTTLTPENELTPFNGPIGKLWELSLKENV